MSYIVELHAPTSHTTYVLAQAATREDAFAQVDARLLREDIDDFVIVAVHTVH